MKRSLIVSAFLLALITSGCSGTQPAAAAPQTQAPPDDAHRDDRDRDHDRDKDRNPPPDGDHRSGCPDGQHAFTDRDGRTSCVNN
jgi:PBP1b-binding outer membrane lipoprotein LpoB